MFHLANYEQYHFLPLRYRLVVYHSNHYSLYHYFIDLEQNELFDLVMGCRIGFEDLVQFPIHTLGHRLSYAVI